MYERESLNCIPVFSMIEQRCVAKIRKWVNKVDGYPYSFWLYKNSKGKIKWEGTFNDYSGRQFRNRYTIRKKGGKIRKNY